MIQTNERPQKFACVDHNRACSGAVAFCDVDERGISLPRCRRHELIWKISRTTSKEGIMNL